MAIAIEKIEAVAPDQASLAAALKIKPSAWGNLGRDQDSAFAWGECQGSGSTPYRVALAMADLGAKCSCPSHKFPCKHSLGLMLHLARSESAFATSEIPGFVNDWAGRRRNPASAGAGKPEAAKPKLSLREAEAETKDAAPDPQAEIRAAKQRERLKAEREASVLSGLEEFDLWSSDILAHGLSSFIADASGKCRLAAQRLVDAKAPALAARVDALPSQLLSLPLDARVDFAIEALGSWHLLAAAYRRQEDLPQALRSDVRRLIGWSEQRQSLIDEPASMRVHADWSVLATLSEVQPDRLRRNETWLLSDAGQTALLLDFIPAAAGSSGPAFLEGERFAAELVFYPSAEPLRALLVSKSEAATDAAPPTTLDMDAALDAFEARRARQPWLGAAPISFKTRTVQQTKKGALWISDDSGSLPLDPRQRDELIVLKDLPMSAVTGFWDGRYFSMVRAETALGAWTRL